MGTTYRDLFKLYDLIQSGDIRLVESFLRGNRISINDIVPCKGIGILHLAVGIDPIEKSKKCTEIILKYGGDPNLCNDDGITPVHIAAIWGRLDNLKLLIGCGGDPSRRDFDGHSAFDYAAREEQWDVYDYLHNVIDPLDDSLSSKCAYTLELEKVMVTTDQVVAAYEPLVEEKLNNINLTSSRKSQMVRDWCEKTSLVVNKLYPTILGDTYILDNESAPWKNIDFTKSLTLDLTQHRNSKHSELNETNNSFKTCLSKKLPYDVDISGIKHLDITADQSNNCSCSNSNSNNNCRNNRMSIYENFSLPGSPQNISHKNYNTKSSIKKTMCCIEAENHLLTFDNSQPLISDDKSIDLDKAMAVAQNKANEWLSFSSNSDPSGSHVRATNTRRSSASSGVSSNYSGGSIMIASMQEEYKYEDKDEDVVLIEKRLLVSPIVLPLEEGAETSPDQTILSVASSLPPSVNYDNNTLRAELIRLGFRPGPIQDSTRTLYLKKLQALKKTPNVVRDHGKTYSIELEKSLRNHEWMKNLNPYIELENKVQADFANPNKKWREGTSKTSFTYLLLDPRVTDNLPAKSSKQADHITWITFINSIFYIGKGKRSRPYSHLYQALTLWKRDFTTSNDKKVQHILDIWSDKVGVVCLHIFQNVIPAEAYTYEASMIDVLGLPNLKNQKCGNYYGIAASWPLKERRMLGLYLLYKALQIFLSEGERQLRPDDID
ncbi:ankyrin repeat and LEM domain-containing protein 1-like isoform X1 [Galleria mellonella]|uniref:Ankyrin repeat and LEM domain-containing protein 1-like isoform X1 n=1 Tax=Galleria mellonella TaxID=7137 RepID=A0A6J1X1W0_GALME|nr:ankyrin repeat and LEM domain-containing protein 1-like isoform X1 [Galleria mellonella]